MTNNTPNATGSELHPPAPSDKRHYVKPAFQREEVFETMALACGKIRGTQGQCRRVASNS